MKTEKIEEVLKFVDWKVNDKRMDDLIPEACAELAALKSTAEDLECLLGEAQVENKELREVIEKAKEQLQKCADWLMSAQGYLMAGIRDRLKGCEVETRALIKQLEEEK